MFQYFFYRLANISVKLRIYINKAVLYISSTTLRKNKKINFDINSIVPYQKIELYKLGGNYIIGKKVQFGYNIGGRYKNGYCELQARNFNSLIYIGDYTAINNNFLAISTKKITIGAHCRIGINCQILDSDFHDINPLTRNLPGEAKEVVIEDNVWFGNNVIILKGVHIGENSIIGAGAVVISDIPANMIAGGIPCKVIRHIFFK